MLLRNVCQRVPEGQTDRSQARSAWESVPRKNRPVGYGMIGHSESFVTPIIESVRTLHESDRTLRDGFFGWRCPWHFVPGYDRTVPPGRILVGALRPQS
jgi:hypothetical protein